MAEDRALFPRSFQFFGAARLLHMTQTENNEVITSGHEGVLKGREASMGEWFSSLTLQCLETL